MKTLWLMRHAKAEPDSDGSDRQRSLMESGIAAARRIGGELAQAANQPQVILCSDAVRTLQTARLVAEALGLSDRIESCSTLYQAEWPDLQNLLAGRTEARVLVVGHNPFLAALAIDFGQVNFEMKPAACLGLDFNLATWTDLDRGTPTLAATFFLP